MCEWNVFKSVNIWQSYKQERGCFMHFARLSNTLIKDEESARYNHVFACNFAKYSPILILIFFHPQTQQSTFLNSVINNHTLNMQLHYLVICR